MTDPLLSADGRFRAYFHSAEAMRELADDSIECVVTSPPYGLGIDYSNERSGDEAVGSARTDGQIETPVLSMKDYDDYIRRMEPVWMETYRVMLPGAYACINFGAIHAKAEYFGHSFMFPQLDDVCRYWRKELGAEFRWKYIWVARRTNHNYLGQNMPVLGSYPLPLEGQVIREIEEIAVLRKPGPACSGERLERRRKSRMTLAEWRESFNQVWEFTGEGKYESGGVTHPAVFPLELPLRLIRAYSCVGDLVLDPFLGSGTTMLAARRLGRKCVGYEVETRYRDMIAEKTGILGPPIGRGSKLSEFEEATV